MNKIEKLSKKHEAAARELMAAIQEAYPVGTIVRAKITGGDDGKWIEAEVVEQAWQSTRYPHELLVKNTRTGKTRTVSIGSHGYPVELVRLPHPRP